MLNNNMKFNIIFTVGDPNMSAMEFDEDYEEEEYENSELPEDNTEKAKEIKDAVKAVGEQVFDIQDQLKEGDYLKLMNLLQLVANKVDS